MQKIVALLIKTGYYRSNKSINDKVPPGTAIPDGTNSNDVAASKELFMSHAYSVVRVYCSTQSGYMASLFRWKTLEKACFFVRLRSKTGLDIDN